MHNQSSVHTKPFVNAIEPTAVSYISQIGNNSLLQVVLSIALIIIFDIYLRSFVTCGVLLESESLVSIVPCFLC